MTPCPVCGGEARFPLRFCDPCRDSGRSIHWLKANQPPRPEHAPGHPIGLQAGPPNGQGGYFYSRFCLVPECDWRETS